MNGKKKQRTDSAHDVDCSRAAVRLLELLGETMRWVLDDVAQVASDWLRVHLKEAWMKRYARHFAGYSLSRRLARPAP